MRDLSETGQKVFAARYAARNEQGEVIEDFAQAVERIAKAAASIEEGRQKAVWTERFMTAIGNLEFVPSTPIWANVGKDDRPWQPSACFVLAVQDSLDSMYETLKETALVFKSGGGVGYNFSPIRPRGCLVNSTKGKASGVVELIRLYDASSGMVMQGGVRRGASMAILNVDHPEIIDFINSKRNGAITHFNLSVGITDAFMEARDNDQDWPLTFNGRLYQTVKARDLWRMITEAAHACGDPGLIFLDRIQEDNPVPSKRIDATNPCGEQPLYPGESCLLGSISLEKMLRPLEDSCEIDWDRLATVTQTGVRFLDNIIDIAAYPLAYIEQATRATRKIGLGVTGLHDMLIMLGIPYDSQEGRRTAADIIRFIQETAHAYSEELADLRGPFPDWEQSVFYPHSKRRNATCITIAPTGSVTTMAGCEGYGIEPIFAVAYSKATDVAGTFEVFSPLFQAACEEHGVPQEVMSEVAHRGSCQGVEGVPEAIQTVFKGAQDITPEDHVLMQIELQKHVDNAISKTVNLPNAATVEDIAKIYEMAYEGGLKGITIFRDGCKDGVVTVGRKGATPRKPGDYARGEIRPRPDHAQGVTHRLVSGCGKIYLTVNYLPENGEIIETFITTGSDGGCLIYTEATSRLISLAIRGGISIEEIVEQLNSTHACPAYQLARGRGKPVSPGKSCASAIARKLIEIKEQLAERHHEGQPNEQSDPSLQNDIEESPDRCPICGTKMRRAEGCFVCHNCGYGKC